jgi:hypothetical protein
MPSARSSGQRLQGRLQGEKSLLFTATKTKWKIFDEAVV